MFIQGWICHPKPSKFKSFPGMFYRVLWREEGLSSPCHMPLEIRTSEIHKKRKMWILRGSSEPLPQLPSKTMQQNIILRTCPASFWPRHCWGMSQTFVLGLIAAICYYACKLHIHMMELEKRWTRITKSKPDFREKEDEGGKPVECKNSESCLHMFG